MRSVPERSTLATFGVLIGCLLAGPLLGLRLGERFAPESDVAQLASIAAFPLAFAGGLVFWQGLGIGTVALGALRNLLRGKLPSAAQSSCEALVPPGYAAFVVLSVLFAAGAALFVALLTDASAASAIPAYAAAGAAYGASLWLLAHHGYLPFPEPG